MKNKNLFNSRFVFIFGSFNKKNKTVKPNSSETLDLDYESPKELRAEEKAERKEAKRLKKQKKEWKAREAKRAELEKEFDIPEQPEATRAKINDTIRKNIGPELNQLFKDHALITMIRQLPNIYFDKYLSKTKGMKNTKEKRESAYDILQEHKHQVMREKNEPKFPKKDKKTGEIKMIGYRFWNQKPNSKKFEPSNFQKKVLEGKVFEIHKEMLSIATKLKSDAINNYTSSLNFEDLLKYEKKLLSNSDTGLVEDGELSYMDINDGMAQIMPDDSFDKLV